MKVYSADYINSLISNFYNDLNNKIEDEKNSLSTQFTTALSNKEKDIMNLISVNYLPTNGTGSLLNQLTIVSDTSAGTVSVNKDIMSLYLDNQRNARMSLYRDQIVFASNTDTDSSPTMLLTNHKSVGIGYDLLTDVVNRKCGLLKIKASDTDTQPLPEIYLCKNSKSIGRITTAPDQNLSFGHFNAEDKSYTSLVEITKINASSPENSQNLEVYTNLNVSKDLLVNKSITVNENLNVKGNLNITKNLNINEGLNVGKNLDIGENLSVTKKIEAKGGIQLDEGSTLTLSDSAPSARLGLTSSGDVFISNKQGDMLTLGDNSAITYCDAQVYTTNFKPTLAQIGAARSDYADGTANNTKKFNGYSLWVGTQEDYDSLARKDNNVIYMITD